MIARNELEPTIELPTDNGVLHLQTLRSHFANASGLKYRTAAGNWRGLPCNGTRVSGPFIPNTTYVCSFNGAAAGPAPAAAVQNDDLNVSLAGARITTVTTNANGQVTVETKINGRKVSRRVNGVLQQLTGRTTISDDQRKTMEKYFRKNNYPGKKTLEKLSEKTVLEVSVIATWFKNRRRRGPASRGSIQS